MSTRSTEVNTEIELEFEDQDFIGECGMCGVYLYKNDYWCPACEYGRRESNSKMEVCYKIDNILDELQSDTKLNYCNLRL